VSKFVLRGPAVISGFATIIAKGKIEPRVPDASRLYINSADGVATV